MTYVPQNSRDTYACGFDVEFGNRYFTGAKSAWSFEQKVDYMVANYDMVGESRVWPANLQGASMRLRRNALRTRRAADVVSGYNAWA